MTYNIKFHALCNPQAIHILDRHKTSIEKIIETKYKFIIPTKAYTKSASIKLDKCGKTNAVELTKIANGIDILFFNELSKNPLHIISSAAP
jgi:hypothetical protein